MKPSVMSLAIFTCMGSFFLGALITAINKGIKDEGWFDFNKRENDN